MIQGVSGGDEGRVNGPAGQRLESHRADELLRRAREHHIDLGARLREQARERRGLVARNPPSDTQEDPASVERANGITPRAPAP
jgi:hypothetical protein